MLFLNLSCLTVMILNNENIIRKSLISTVITARTILKDFACTLVHSKTHKRKHVQRNPYCRNIEANISDAVDNEISMGSRR